MGDQMSDRQAASQTAQDQRAIADLLNRLATALTSGDGRAVAAMWETPAFVIGRDGAQAVTSRQEFEQFFSGAKEQYNAQGITDTRAEIVRLDWIGDRLALVQVRWPYLDQHGQAKGSETSTYTLRRDDAGEWRLRVALMHGASET
jgi:uncharacterized protein (TIGR02246 family)